MNLKLIDTAIAGYEKDATESEKARLEFFRGLFEIQQHESEVVAAENGYDPFDEEEAKRLYWSGQPMLVERPVEIDPDAFAGTCKTIAAYLIREAGFEPAVSKALSVYDWKIFCNAADLARAGKDPAAFVEDCLQNIDEYRIDTDCPAKIFMMVPTLSLRAYLQQPAKMLMEALHLTQEEQNTHDHPLRCPVCGSPATAASVGDTDASDGRGRMLYCAHCGSQWAFERIRCGCCGTQNQASLHYFNLEGDEAHRLQNCEECGDYMRTVFQDDLSVPVVMEVEDVVMAKLDAVALDPRFRKE